MQPGKQESFFSNKLLDWDLNSSCLWLAGNEGNRKEKDATVVLRIIWKFPKIGDPHLDPQIL